MEEEKDHDQALIHPKELFSSVQYEKALHGADLVYELDSVLLRERIMLHSAEEGREKYVYTLNWDGEIQETEEGLLFCEGEETILRLHAPELIDNKGEYAETKTELKKTGAGDYSYTVTVPLDWLRAEERSYPVVLDPSVGVPFKDYIVDYHISSSGTVKDRDSLMVGSGKKYRSVIKPDLSTVTFPDDCFLQEADLVMSRYVYDGTSDGNTKNVAVQLYLSTITWPSNSSQIATLYNAIDTTQADSQAKASAANQLSSWDITEIGRKWNAGQDTDKGLLLKSFDDSTYVYFRSSKFSARYNTHPYFSFLFADANGKDDRWNYYSQSTSRCGTASINTYSGSLHLERVDGQVTNGCLPVAVGFSYNGADRDTDIGYGKGYTMSFAQKLQEVHFSDPVYGSETKYLCLTDGQGTDRYYLYKSSTEWEYELDHKTKITVSGSGNTYTATLEDKKGNQMIFTAAKENSLLYGRLTTVRDANGNEIAVTYRNSNDLRDLRVTEVRENLAGQDPTDQQHIGFTYTGDLLSGITVPNGLNVSYTYDSDGYLTTVTYADGLQASYAYNSDGYLTSMEDPDTYRVLYTWGSGVQAERVIGVEEKTGTGQDEETGHSLAFTYTRNTTKVVDDRDRDTVYQFDNYGQVCSVRDTEGNAVYSAYNTAAQAVTELTSVSKMQKTVVNLLLNHGFETGSADSWTVSNSTNVKAVTTKYHTGKYSLQIQNQGSYATQAAAVTAGEVYTLSAYFTGAAGGKLQVWNGTALLAETEESTSTTDWERLYTTFTVPSDVSSVTVKLLMNQSGTVYCDGVQLERSDSPSRYNMVNNGSFLSTNAGFTTRSQYCTANDTVIDITGQTAIEATHPEELGNQVFHMVGSPQREKTIDQIINVAGGLTGDTYSFGGWLKSNGTPPKGRHDTTTSTYYNGIKKLEVTLLNDSTSKGTAAITFGADTTEWQYGCAAVAATGNYNKIRIRMTFSCISNDAYFDGIQLYKETFSTAYTYNSNGEVTKRSSLIGQQTEYTYNDANDMTSSKDPRGNTTTYTYDSHHNLIEVKSPENVYQTFTRNTRGQATEKQVKNSDGSLYIKTTQEYEAATALAHAVTDARNKSVTYGYNSTTRQRTTITDPKNNVSTYGYGNAQDMLRLASLTSTDTGTVSYGYDQYGKLTTVTRGTTIYGLTYDAWNRPLETKVGTTALSANEYDTTTRLLKKVTYANGFEVRYVYDELDRVTEIYEKYSNTEALAYEFQYNNEGDLYALRNRKTGRVSFFEYDHAGRCMACTEYAFTVVNDQVTLGSKLSGYMYEYDPNNNLTKLTCNAAGGSWETVYTYDKDNRTVTATFANGKVLTVTYDAIGRVTKRRLGLTSNYDTDLTYVPGHDGSQTALLSTYQNGSDTAYAYAYDDNGNITSITRGSTSVTYQYNGANELIRENNGFTNQTVTYTYDTWGNITEKKIYAYTTATNPGTPTSTIPYVYSTGTWKDQLTSYNGQTISYDSMGNPTTYRGKTLTWNGKELTSVTGTATYTYDMNGLRTTKTVGGTTTNYFYNNTVLMGLTTGTTYLLFSYDAAGLVQAVNYNGTYYYYLRNGQGDIVKIIDGSGNTVVEYSYDSWGKQLSCTGTLATTLGTLNPFRYRGYVYDEETGFYYLKSRYYDPETCRFISADVYLSTGQGVIGHNTYAYCLNNSIIRIDEGGNVTYLIIPDFGGDYDPSKEGFRDAFRAFSADVEKAVTVNVTNQGGITISINLNECASSLHNMTQAADLDYSCHIIEDEIHRQLDNKGIHYTPSYKEENKDVFTEIKGKARKYLQWCYPKQYAFTWGWYSYYINKKLFGRDNVWKSEQQYNMSTNQYIYIEKKRTELK